jgi:hypothetical protein
MYCPGKKSQVIPVIIRPIEKSFSPLLRYLEKFSMFFPEILISRSLERLMESAVPDIRIKRKAAPLPIYNKGPDLNSISAIPKKSRS